MKYFNDVTEAVGNTPLIRLNKIAKGVKPEIFAKLESVNPGGSVKDRIGIAMIRDAEEKGLLRPGGTIIEPTSGNTGTGLAMAAAIRGYKVVFVMPDKMSMEKELLLRAYGAEVIRTPSNVSSKDPRSSHKVAERIAAETPNSFMPNQYENSSNPTAHYETTGPEIWGNTDGKVTHFVAGMGTGGTISGTAKYLKEMNPKIKVIGADPGGSIYAARFSKKKANFHPYKVEGIGEDYVPGALNLGLIDEVITVSDRDAFAMARRLVREEGLFIGGSSGSAMCAALKVSKNLPKGDTVVVLFPDTGRNYLSTLFNDQWMKDNGFMQ